jgi:NAD+ kinase
MAARKTVKIGVVVNRGKPASRALLQDLLEYGRLHDDVQFLIENDSARIIGEKGRPLKQLTRCVDFFIVAGGDGSLLEFVRQIYPSAIPTLGVNIGSLGFLTALAQEELCGALPLLTRKKLRLSPRLALETVVHRGKRKEIFPCALNDVVISRGDRSQLVRLCVKVGGSLVTQYVCDGLIVCTPTGSTAYSVSAGGPIIAPETRSLSLTPICPHTLTNRSIVIGTSENIRIEIPPQDASVILQFDGQPGGKLCPGDWVEIRPAHSPVVLAYTEDTDFFAVLRHKLRWNGGERVKN